MARIPELCDGAEWNNALWWTSQSGGISASAGAAYSGNYGYQFSDGGNGYKVFPAALDEFYFRFHYNRSASNSDINLVFRNGSTDIIRIYFPRSVAPVEVYIGGSKVATGSIGMSYGGGSWYTIEVHIKMAEAPNGIVQLRINGTLDINYSGDTIPAALTTIDRFQIDNHDGGCWIDDFALNDVSGGADNSWIGESSFILLRPDSNGNYSNWDGSDGNKVDNYALVDENPPNSDTDYEYTSSDNTKQSHGLTTTTIGNGRRVSRIIPQVIAKATAGDNAPIKLGVRSGGVDNLDSTNRTLPAQYGLVCGQEIKADPNGGGDFTQADLDGLEFLMDSSA